MADRMDVMQQLNEQKSTHACPSCSAPTYCAITAGKSASSCWCMSLDHVTTKALSEYEAEACMCRSCLRKIIAD